MELARGVFARKNHERILFCEVFAKSLKEAIIFQNYDVKNPAVKLTRKFLAMIIVFKCPKFFKCIVSSPQLFPTEFSCIYYELSQHDERSCPSHPMHTSMPRTKRERNYERRQTINRNSEIFMEQKRYL